MMGSCGKNAVVSVLLLAAVAFAAADDEAVATPNIPDAAEMRRLEAAAHAEIDAHDSANDERHMAEISRYSMDLEELRKEHYGAMKAQPAATAACDALCAKYDTFHGVHAARRGGLRADRAAYAATRATHREAIDAATVDGVEPPHGADHLAAMVADAKHAAVERAEADHTDQADILIGIARECEEFRRHVAHLAKKAAIKLGDV
jgi:hypothetical protein